MKKMLSLLGAVVFGVVSLNAEITIPKNQAEYMQAYAEQVEAIAFSVQDFATEMVQSLIAAQVADQEQAKQVMQDLIANYVPTLMDQSFALSYLDNWFIQNTTADQHEALVRGMFSYVYGALSPDFLALLSATVPVYAATAENMQQTNQAELIELVKIYLASKIAKVLAYDLPQTYAGFETVYPEESIVVRNEFDKLVWIEDLVKNIQPVRSSENKKPASFDKAAMGKLLGMFLKQVNSSSTAYVETYRNNPIANDAVALKELQKNALLNMVGTQQEDGNAAGQVIAELMQTVGNNEAAVIELLASMVKVLEDYYVAIVRYHHDNAIQIPYASTDTAIQVTEYAQTALTAACTSNLKAWYNLSDEEAAALLA